eukprot:gene18776-22430_t
METGGVALDVIRAQAIDCFGLLLTTESGAAALQPSLPALLQVAVEGFALGHAGLREFTHSFFGHAVEAMKDEFAPYLSHVMHLALQTLQTDDGNIFEDSEQSNPDIVAAVRNAVGDSDDSDDEEGGNRNSVSIRTGIMDEKAAATHLVGKCAEACPTLFGPYVETMFPIMKKMAGYFHEEKVLEAVEIFCDHLEGDAVVPYMAPLMELLMHVVKVGAKKEIQLMALVATCSVAKSGGSSFAPYMPGLISVLQMCMSITQPEMLTIRHAPPPTRSLRENAGTLGTLGSIDGASLGVASSD